MSQARQFEQQLQQRNKIAAQAYRQARGLESRGTRPQQMAQQPGKIIQFPQQRTVRGRRVA